jgi:tetratricopeptide (TPR) repeat protein
LTAATDEALRLGERRRGTRARVALTLHAYWAGSASDGEKEWLHEAVSVLGELGDEVGLAEAWFLIGTIRFDDGHAGDAEPAFERAVQYGRRSGGRQVVSKATIWLLLVLLSGPTPVDVAEQRLEGIAGAASGDLDVESQMLNTAAVLAAMREDFPRAWQLAGAARHLATGLGKASAGAACSLVDFQIAMRQDDLGAAAEGLEAGDRYLEEIGEQGFRSSVLGMLAHVRIAQGRLDEAVQAAELAERMTAPDDLISSVLWRTGRAKAVSLRGAPEAAEALAREAVALAADSDWLCLHGDALLDLADVRQRAGKDADAAAAASAALALYLQKGDLASADRAHAFLPG